MKTTKLFRLLLAFAVVVFTASCGDDDPVIIIEDGLSVADGFYLAKAGEDPEAVAQLKSSMVDAPDFGAQSREGFVQTYAFLTAGSYNMVEVVGKEITNTYGGTVESITEVPSVDNEECETTEYSLVKAAVDGAAFVISTDGLYVIAYDAQLGEIVFDQITSVGIIGDGTAGGWGTDSELPGSVTSEGGSWEATGVILDLGVFKYRFNCRWAIDRRLDSNDPFDNANGYSFFTNFAGSLDLLLAGNEGSNIESDEYAEFTMKMTWNPTTGFAAEKTRTGDAPEKTFIPSEWNWGIIGDATADAWDSDRDMYYGGEDSGTHSWYTVITLAETGKFKFRINDAWDTNLGGTLNTTEDALTLGGADMDSPGAGDYYIALQTSDEGITWSATMSEAGWGIIGDGSPQGNWDADLDMTAAFDAGITTYSITGDFTTAEWKFRAGDDWAYSLGGDMTALTAGGDNLSLSEAGNYTVVLSYDGTAYSAVATKN